MQQLIPTGSTGSVKNWPESYGHDSIIELRKLGNPVFARGTFGEISIALKRDSPSNSTCRFVGVKTLFKSTKVSFAFGSDGEWQASEKTLCPIVSNELKALHKLRPHPNIITLLALYTSPGGGYSMDTLSLAFEYCPTDLHLTIEWRRRSILSLLSFETIQTIASDLMAALYHCHSVHGILHRDIKPGNILISSNGVVKLCDFGLARTFSTLEAPDQLPPQKEDGLCTLAYRPPEILLGGEYIHPSADMFSVGVVIAELVLGRILFSGVNNLDQLGLVFASLGTPTAMHWPEANKLPHSALEFRLQTPLLVTNFIPRTMECKPLADLLQSCLELDPKRRISATDAMQHCCFEPQRLASRATMQLDLIPKRLDEPFLLLSRDEDIEVATRQALALATTRRTFLKELNGLPL